MEELAMRKKRETFQKSSSQLRHMCKKDKWKVIP